jgi:bacillithiol biosynthesis cysteine-adding enzyme BshC
MTVVPLENLPGIPALARGLASGDPDVSAFLPDRPETETIQDRAARVLERFSWRASSRADPELSELATGRVAGVFTGQQVGLFGGPVLTLVKAIAAVKLARDLTGRGTALCPVFWCASEDHDLVEVTRVALPGPDGPVEAGPDPTAFTANRKPVGDLVPGVDLEAIVARAVEGLAQPPDEDARQAFLSLAKGRTFREGFVGTLRWLTAAPELRFANAARSEDKPDLVPLAARLVRERAAVRALLAEREARLTAAAHPLQVTADPAALPLFAIVAGERYLVRETRDGLELKGQENGEALPPEEVVARFESGAWLPSFSALTRPLAASTLYPVAATILGPAEIAYWAQAYPLFDWAGLVPPVIVPRPMVALLSPVARRLLAKLDITITEVLQGTDALLKKCGAGRAHEILAGLEAAKGAALEALQALRPELAAIDLSLEKAVETTREKLAFAFEKLAEKTAGAAGRADETLAAQVKRVAAEIAPGGTLVERVYSALPYALRYGRDGIAGPLTRDLRWDVPGLQVIELS